MQYRMYTSCILHLYYCSELLEPLCKWYEVLLIHRNLLYFYNSEYYSTFIISQEYVLLSYQLFSFLISFSGLYNYNTWHCPTVLHISALCNHPSIILIPSFPFLALSKALVSSPTPFLLVVFYAIQSICGICMDAGSLTAFYYFNFV